MLVISIKWKDTDDKTYKDFKYRKMMIKRMNGGWTIEGIDDNNIYHCIECAENEIDKILGGKTRKNADVRHAHGIHVIGHK